jgi:hypothetical protein
MRFEIPFQAKTTSNNGNKTKAWRRIVGVYLSARDKVINSGFATEIDWQDGRKLVDLTETEFLRESSWVILSAGMKETVIRRHFKELSRAFYEWESAHIIASNRKRCRFKALSVFNHPGKVKAIIDLCDRVDEDGFDSIHSSIMFGGVQYLRTFDFIGPTTCYHLAKNIGLDVVKPDRHLVRIARAAKFEDPHALCRMIADVTGDKLAVVDLVLWRFATMDRKYVSYFQYAAAK